MRCEHCLDVIPKAQAVKSEINGQTLYFCCRACLAVYEFLHQECAPNICATEPPKRSTAQNQTALTADTQFKQLFLGLVIAVQTVLLLFATYSWQVLALNIETVQLFNKLLLVFATLLLLLLVRSLGRSIVQKYGGVQQFNLLANVFVFLLAMQQLYFFQSIFYLGLFIAHSVLILLIQYWDPRWRSIELYLLPVLTINKLDQLASYISYVLMIVSAAWFMLILPQDIEQAYLLVISIFLALNPYILRLTAPLALYSVDKTLRNLGVNLRSLSVLEQLAKITAVLAQQQLYSQLKHPRIIIEKLMGEHDEQILQLRLLKEQHKVLLLSDNEASKELQSLSNVSAMLGRESGKDAAQVADVVLSDKPEQLTVLLAQAKKFRWYIQLFIIAWLVYALFVLGFLSIGSIGPLNALVLFGMVLVIQRVFGKLFLTCHKKLFR